MPISPLHLHANFHSLTPSQDTCLSLLNSLLVSEDDNDYLRTIIRIPPEPLLSYLEPYESDIDSGIENQHRDTSVSGTTRSSSDYQVWLYIILTSRT